MPVYQNTSEESRVFQLQYYGRVDPGVTVQTKRYVWPIPDGFSLISDDGAIALWFTLLDGQIPTDAIAGLAQFARIIIINGSGGVLQLQANGDTTNTNGANLLFVADGDTKEIDNQLDAQGMRDLNSLLLTGEGTGDVQVIGLTRYGRWQE